MRHRNSSVRLSQKPHHSWAMQRNLLTSLLLYERIRTTKKRALVIRPLVDKVVTIGKSDRTDLAIRRINELVTDDNACRKVLEVLKDRFAGRSGGFTKIVPVGMRGGDGAKLVDIMLIEAVGVEGSSASPTSSKK